MCIIDIDRQRYNDDDQISTNETNSYWKSIDLSHCKESQTTITFSNMANWKQQEI